jgi:hypothetical protein
MSKPHYVIEVKQGESEWKPIPDQHGNAYRFTSKSEANRMAMFARVSYDHGANAESTQIRVTEVP